MSDGVDAHVEKVAAHRPYGLDCKCGHPINSDADWARHLIDALQLTKEWAVVVVDDYPGAVVRQAGPYAFQEAAEIDKRSRYSDDCYVRAAGGGDRPLLPFVQDLLGMRRDQRQPVVGDAELGVPVRRNPRSRHQRRQEHTSGRAGRFSLWRRRKTSPLLERTGDCLRSRKPNSRGLESPPFRDGE